MQWSRLPFFGSVESFQPRNGSADHLIASDLVAVSGEEQPSYDYNPGQFNVLRSHAPGEAGREVVVRPGRHIHGKV